MDTMDIFKLFNHEGISRDQLKESYYFYIDLLFHLMSNPSSTETDSALNILVKETLL